MPVRGDEHLNSCIEALNTQSNLILIGLIFWGKEKHYLGEWKLYLWCDFLPVRGDKVLLLLPQAIKPLWVLG